MPIDFLPPTKSEIKRGEMITFEHLPLQDVVEMLIDRHGLYALTNTIAQICEDKAEHLETNWQDRVAAKRWTRAGAAFDRLFVQLKKIQLP